MPRKSIRRRPATPNLNVAQLQAQVQAQNQTLTADPNSPPETPTTSPPFSRKISLKPRRQPDFHENYFQPLASDPNIKPVGDGHQFSYQPSMGPEQLSPRSSSSSDMVDDSDDEDSSSEDDDESGSPSVRSIGNATGPAVSSPIDDSDIELDDDDDDTDTSSDSDTSESDSGSSSDRSGATDEAETSHITVTSTATATCNFTLEDVDPMDSDCDGLDVLQPTEIESNRSRSRSRHRKAHKTMVKDFGNLTCSNETSDNEQDDQEVEFLNRRQQLKKFRRMSMGSSFGKRTHSELSDSEDDGEGLDANEVGSSARRMRRKMHRTSLLFHDPPPARIEELEEPDSSEDELVTHQHLARELPYWAIEIMEMGSSSS
ncbi:hypothetical protein NW762_001364 [Fusarium torreyae]|uniref:Uncharacterized protein n=1 Tax=Fusarium torreyae TaxID=1237075 RepID=A0A9W8SDX7_9HYPO|nr:hypothetical protein NW762_001364 [Fusarium torreyae]